MSVFTLSHLTELPSLYCYPLALSFKLLRTKSSLYLSMQHFYVVASFESKNLKYFYGIQKSLDHGHHAISDFTVTLSSALGQLPSVTVHIPSSYFIKLCQPVSASVCYSHTHFVCVSVCLFVRVPEKCSRSF